MNTSRESERIGALLDGCLDKVQRQELAARLEHDVDLQRELEAVRCVRTVVRAMGKHHAAPPMLRQRVRAMMQAHARGRPAFGAWWARLAQLPGAIVWPSVGGAFAMLCLAIAMHTTMLSGSGGDQRLMQAAVANHLRATAGGQLVQVASSDRDTVQPWLRSRLAFDTPVGLPAVPGTSLVGARTDTLNDLSVAAVVYRVRDHVVNAFIWPADDAGSAIATASLNGLSVGRWSRGGVRYCVVSDLPEAQLLAFAESLAQADETP